MNRKSGDPARQLVPVPKALELQASLYLELPIGTAASIRQYTVGDSLPAGFSWERTQPAGPGRFDWYRMTIDESSVLIECVEEKILFTAMQTIRQLIDHHGPAYRLPCGMVEDWSDLEWRAVMLDISRDRVPTMGTLLSLIDLFAGLKYNQLQLYMEHTYAYTGHENVWEHASPLTPDEFRQLEAYCAARGIELVPNQNSFGHMERWLRHPEYHHLAEMPDGFIDPWDVFRPESSTLAPAVPGSLELVADLFSQLLPGRMSPYVNIGGDEPWELGQGRSETLCAQKGLDRVYVDFLEGIHRLAADYGKRIMVWADVLMKHPDVVKSLPGDMVLMDWGYEADHPFASECALLSDSGFDYVICAGNSAWNTIGGRWKNAEGNLLNAVKHAHANAHPARGLMVTEWGDNGHWQQLPIGIPGFILGSEAAWNGTDVHLLDMPWAVASSFREHPALLYGEWDHGHEREDVVPAVGPLAQALMRIEGIGEIYLEETGRPKIHNTTLLGALLLDHLAPYYAEDIARFAGYRFERELTELDRVDGLLATVPTGLLMQAELSWTARMLRFSCELGTERLSGSGLLPITGIPQPRAAELAAQLEVLIAEYRRLWQERSRPGGLGDSAGRLESLVKLFRNLPER